ncbi:acyltransferase family protein [Clostridium sp.]|uniref:acyltransferase family protein n=1 Tax=Clostridium sp. TaxID=1506 RepID=UPI00260BF4B8|nr:acyltransferase family protein [Clostridium sp.]
MNTVLLQKKRLDYLDIAKGILIISVVLCHSPFDKAWYLYWFHMPAFFIISGMLYREGLSIKEQALKFFIPYLIFSLIDIGFNYAMYFHGSFGVRGFFHELEKYLYGGKATWGVFWFIPVMFVTKILFDKLNSKLKPKTLALVCILSYILAHVYSMNFIPEHVEEITRNNYVFWNLDNVLITLPYYAIGYYITKKNIQKIFHSTKTIIISAVAIVILCIINIDQGVYYYLNIKYSLYQNPVFDLLMPVAITVFILSLSSKISNLKYKKLFTIIGSNSLVIMYLHKPIATLFMDVFKYGYITFTLVGVFIPLLMTILIDKSLVSKFLFKGDLTLYRMLKNKALSMEMIKPKDIIVENRQ